MKILVVDDEVRIREVVSEYAKVSGFECDQASDGLQAIEMVLKNDYDCIVLDIMMPELDGFAALKRIKEIKNIPVIMLSARQEEYDKLFSFDLGVDDYVTKPFSPKELMARIKVVTERNKSKTGDKFTYEDMVLDISGRSLTIEGNKVTLTPKEMDLLIFLVKNRNIALGREKLLNAVWDYDYFGEDRTVDTHIKMLRKNLGKYRDLIVTVRGMGYKFEV
ncbi:MAG: response regulator transcription factor [Erysipelotrichaceae bacterium]|nr:response regulator transcription factor [Erysipelotrichaceae bacterium]MBR4483736.1 response regulator transcription factor [Erysipelotrichaceae bacterium]